MIDAFGSDHTTDNPVATASFTDATRALAAHAQDVGAHLDAALAAEPTMTAAHALSGLMEVLLSDERRLPAARASLARSRAGLGGDGAGTAFERALVAALDHAISGRLRAAGDGLDDFLYRQPDAFVAAKLSHAFRYLSGDTDGMVSLTARLNAHCDPTRAGYGYLLGCHAFGLEEIGRLQEAERVGRRALELCPDDVWALHAVAHVHEMRGHTANGVAWLDDHRHVWSRRAGFSRHIAWHLALLHLEEGRYDEVLAIYDRDIADDVSADFRDFADASSLLWRLRQAGVEPGADRWNRLADDAATRAKHATLVFAQLHFLIALIAAQRFDEAEDVAKSIHRRSWENTDQARVAHNVGYELAMALLQSAQDDTQSPRTGFLARRLHRIGGSHAQRDVFLRSLAVMAQETNDASGLRQVLAVRRRNKSDDRFASSLLALMPDAVYAQMPTVA